MTFRWISIHASYASLISFCTGEADKASSLSDSTAVSQESHLSSAGVGNLPYPTGVLLSNKTVLLDGHPHSILLWLDRCFPCHKLNIFEQQHLDPFSPSLSHFRATDKLLQTLTESFSQIVLTFANLGNTISARPLLEAHGSPRDLAVKYTTYVTHCRHVLERRKE